MIIPHLRPFQTIYINISVRSVWFIFKKFFNIDKPPKVFNVIFFQFKSWVISLTFRSLFSPIMQKRRKIQEETNLQIQRKNKEHKNKSNFRI